MTQPIRVHLVTSPDQTVVQVWGEIDVLTARSLQTTIDKALDTEPPRVVVDLTHVSFIDSSGLHVLIGAFHRLGSGAFAIIAQRPNVLRVFSISGIDRVIPVFASIDEATTGLDGLTTARAGDPTN